MIDQIVKWLPVIVSIVALIGVLISTYIQSSNVQRQIKSSHSLKIAEMRQAWINDLRLAMADYGACAVAMTMEERLKDKDAVSNAIRVRLYMNPKDNDYEKMLSAYSDLFNAQTDSARFDKMNIVVDVGQGILKREWDRLKNDVELAANPTAGRRVNPS